MSARLVRCALAGVAGITALLFLAAAAPPPSPSPVPSLSPPPAALGSSGTLDPEAATEAWLARLPPEQRQKSDSYFEGGYWLQLWGFLYGLGIAALLLGTGLSAGMRDRAERWTRFRGLQVFLYWVQYLILTAVLGFPLTVYEGYFREHQYGLSNQTFGAWMGDLLKGLGVGLFLGGLAMVAIYAVFRRAPRTWWLWGTVVALIFVMVGALIAPVFIAPLFNQYTELTDPGLRAPILSLARANGIPADHVYVVDASRQSKRVSANVSGFLGTMRISLNDNLLHRVTPEGIEAVMGHEMGHYVLNHIYKMIVFAALVLLLGFGFLRWSFDRVAARNGARWGIRGVADPAGLPLLAALFSVFFFAMTPVLNTSVRTSEAEADIFGLNAARQPDGFAEVSLMLSEYRKLHPGPIEEWVFFDHPSGYHRILMAMRWKAEHLHDLAPLAPLAPPAGVVPAADQAGR
jgi:STE24 endopeptidase